MEQAGGLGYRTGGMGYIEQVGWSIEQVRLGYVETGAIAGDWLTKTWFGVVDYLPIYLHMMYIDLCYICHWPISTSC